MAKFFWPVIVLILIAISIGTCIPQRPSPTDPQPAVTSAPPHTSTPLDVPPPSPTALLPASNPSPAPTNPQQPPDNPGFGIDYCQEDLADCAALGATWGRYTGIRSVEQAQTVLDTAQALGMRLVLRLNMGDWGWDGQRFDMSHLESFRPVFDHPALIGFYGLHEPLERFELDQLRLFYQQFHAVADQRVKLWHDIGRLPDGFSDGICDLCGVFTNPHVINQNGQPANDWSRTDPRLASALEQMKNAPESTLCVLVQTYGGDARRFLRIPAPEEYLENMRRIVEVYGVQCVTNYAYHHGAYDQTLGDPDQTALREAVKLAYQLYFAPQGENP